MSALAAHEDVLETAKLKGLAEGRAEGILGSRKAIAVKLKAVGLTTADIIQATGLTSEEVLDSL